MIDSLRPITASEPDSCVWAGATWVGQVHEQRIRGERIDLLGGDSFSRARLLVWTAGQARGFIEVPVSDGNVEVATVRAEVDRLPDVEARQPRLYLPPISVAVCTRDRPEQLTQALGHLIDLEYPFFEVLVVDNNPASGLTPPVVDSFADAGAKLVSAHGQGLSIARNTALKNATHNIVAFTDDDVIVDANWLANLAYGFGRDQRVACVCGMVPSAELATPAQCYFDRRVGWAQRCNPALYDLAEPPADDPLFPFGVAQFGTGANFAVRRDVALALGGFDEGMGVGSPTGGGEDIDMFVRVLLGAWMLVREPSAVVWHRHRPSAEELETQIHDYGTGLGAWISKQLLRPRTSAMVLQRVRPAIRHLRGVTVVDQPNIIAADPRLHRLGRRELSGVLTGPLALARARIAGRKAQPMKTSSLGVMRALSLRRGQMWGDPGNSIAAGRLAVAAVTLGLVGLLGAVQTLPSLVLLLAVGAFVLVGPGSLALSWYTRLPTAVVISLVPIVSLAICLLVVTGLLMADYYDPVDALLGIAGATVIAGVMRCGYLARRAAVRTS